MLAMIQDLQQLMADQDAELAAAKLAVDKANADLVALAAAPLAPSAALTAAEITTAVLAANAGKTRDHSKDLNTVVKWSAEDPLFRADDFVEDLESIFHLKSTPEADKVALIVA